MTDRPILFSAPMVRALLAGTKTQTRRRIKVEAERPIMEFVKVATDKDTGQAIYEMKDKAGQHVAIAAGKNFVTLHYSPSIAVGDRLWVRENFRGPKPYEAHGYKIRDWGNKPLWYTADGDPPQQSEWQFWPKARPSIHMPRWASRITLLVDDVKVERLNEISEDAAAAEGWPAPEDRAKTGLAEIRDAYPIGWYAGVWEGINGPGSWEKNPWVVAYTFRVVLENIDFIGRAA